jgi:O-antigen biosynthesis protein
MLEWTGERYLPWVEDSTIAYEHLHRYAYAAALVADKRVLDLASGEGYGAKMLAQSASSVVGIDSDEGAVRHANAKYAGKTLQFIQGSITDVPLLENQSFDIVVCFEAIEHIEDHEKLISEVKRLLKPAGAFVVSTPNKVIYDGQSTHENPFHLKELEFQEFEMLLARHFGHTQFLGQRIHPSSAIWPIKRSTATGFHEFVIDRNESEFSFIHDDLRIPVYFIGVASDSAVMPAMPASVLVDHSNGLLQEKDQSIAARDKTIASQEHAITWQAGQIKELTAGLDWLRNRVTEMEHTIASHEEALAWRAEQVERLEAENSALIGTLRTTQNDLHLTTNQLTAIHASSGWKLIVRLRALRERALPMGSGRRKLFESFMALVKPRA